MKKIKMSALVLAAASIASTSVMAQSSDAQAWAGPFVQAKVGYASFSPTVGNGSLAFSGNSNLMIPPLGGTYNASASNLNTATAAVDAGYNFAVDSKMTVGLGLTYYTGATGTSNATLSPTLNVLGPGPQVNLNYQLKNLWAITIQPGYAIDKERLVYGKVGYTGVTIGASGSSDPSTLVAGRAGSSVAYQTVTLSGYTLGLGYKQAITNSLYWLGEVNYGGFSNKTATLAVNNNTVGNGTATGNFGGSGVDFLVGIGYRF